MMGYEQLDSSRLVLKRASSPENLLYVSCECYVAACECMLMTRILERVEVVNYVLNDVYRARRECRGDVDMAVLWITDNCEASRNSPPRQREALEKAERERQEKENRRYADLSYHGRTRDRDRRWEQYDDRLSPVHAYGFGYQNRNLALGHTTYDSMGRPVKGLSDNPLRAHGPSPRKDNNIDSGVLSMDPKSGASRWPHSNSNCDTLRYPKGDGLMYDMPDGTSALPESASDYDLYAAGTIDDHLQRSLLYIQRMESSGPKSLKENPAGSSLKDDWGDVRENLRSKYGDKYFEGERGDILKENPGEEEGVAAEDLNTKPPPYKAVVEEQTKQRYDTVLEEISGKLTARRVPTPSPPSSTPRKSPPAYQSPPLTHRNPPTTPHRYNNPPQTTGNKASQLQHTNNPRPQQTPPPPGGLEQSRRMPSILENSSVQFTQPVVTDCPDGIFPPPPSDLQPPEALGSLDEEGEDDMPPPPPESLDGVDAGLQLLGNIKENPLVNLGFSCCSRKDSDYDDDRFNKPRFQSFRMEDGEFLLRRERGPSPPPRLLPRNGKPNGPYRPERKNFYDNIDNDSNMSSPMGTSSTFSSSADTVVAAAERLTTQKTLHEEPEVEASSPSVESSPSILRKKTDNPDSEIVVPLRRLNVKSQSYEEQRKPAEITDVHRPKSVGFSGDNGGEKWQCATCTYKNQSRHSVCEMCGCSKDLGPDLDPVTSGGPQCPYCTLVNAKGAVLCDACGADLEGCATFI